MNYRIGDLALVEIDNLPKDLKETKTDIMLEGKSNIHEFKGGKIYFSKIQQQTIDCLKSKGIILEHPEFVFGYFVSKKSLLIHREHGIRKIKDSAYVMIKQHEDTNEGMKKVVD